MVISSREAAQLVPKLTRGIHNRQSTSRLLPEPGASEGLQRLRHWLRGDCPDKERCVWVFGTVTKHPIPETRLPNASVADDHDNFVHRNSLRFKLPIL